MIRIPAFSDPTWEGLIDEDVLDRFKDSNVFHGDIINAQLIKTNKEILNLLKSKDIVN